MRTQVWFLGFLWVIALSTGWVCYKQGRTLQGMRIQQGALEKDLHRRASDAASNDGGRMVIIAEPAPTPVARVELMRLRSQVTELRERLRDKERVSNQLAQARSQLAAVDRYANGRVPAGFRRRQDARQVGGATPDGAVETFFWAVEHQDTNVLLQSVLPEVREQLHSQMATRGSAEFFAESPFPSGFRIVGRTNLAPDLMELQIEVGETAPTPMKLRWMDGAWRLGL